MVGSFVEKFFRRTYTLIKLNFMIVMMIFMGGVIFGIGPALLSGSDLYVAHRYEYEDYLFSDLHALFRRNFKNGNIIFYLFGSVIFFVVYNLYLSYQISATWIFFVQILIVFTIVFLAITFLYTIVINSYYEISIINLLKLGFLSFFANIVQLVRFGISLTALYFIFKVMPGLIVFGVFSLMIMVSVESLSLWIPILNERIDYEDI